MTLRDIVDRIFLDLLIVAIVLASFNCGTTFHGDLANAETFADSYVKTFSISAYYSPLPCQNRYATGSYEGDIRLNGSGVNSADGTPVYPGMIAAPKTYSFGTKMYIPGVGTVAVHDRGGAIVASNGVEGVYDRLDIWMGYGDKGLERALKWGKKPVDVTVYGIDDAIQEHVYLEGYSYDEATPNQCTFASQSENYLPDVQIEHDDPLRSNLQPGNKGSDVLALQLQLRHLNFLKTEPNGVYDDLTEHAIFKFQQSQDIVGDADSPGAGVFGPKTRDRMNEIISSRKYTKVLIAQATADYLDAAEATIIVQDDSEAEYVADHLVLDTELEFGMVGPEVIALQEFLKEAGYFKGVLFTDYYGEMTRAAVLEYQLANNIVSSAEEMGAGRVGPATLRSINS